MTDTQLKHLDYVENAITRMANNSFKMKGWMLTIVSALLAIYASKEKTGYLIIALCPILTFWGLDAYYLQLERKFRKLYEEIVNDAIAKTNKQNSSAQQNQLKLMDMSLKKYNEKYASALFSASIWPLYVVCIIILVLCRLLNLLNSVWGF